MSQLNFNFQEPQQPERRGYADPDGTWHEYMYCRFLIHKNGGIEYQYAIFKGRKSLLDPHFPDGVEPPGLHGNRLFVVLHTVQEVRDYVAQALQSYSERPEHERLHHYFYADLRKELIEAGLLQEE